MQAKATIARLIEARQNVRAYTELVYIYREHPEGRAMYEAKLREAEAELASPEAA